MNQEELTYIKIPYPDASDLNFKIAAPLCSLDISPGIGTAWATGRYFDPKLVVPLSLKQSGNAAEVIVVGAFAYRTPPARLPHLNLSFGRLKPFSLSIAAGNLKDQLDFGGLPLTSLVIQYGAGDQIIDFSYPNPQVMALMKVTADTGLIQIENFNNAKAAKVRLSGDGACYRINFSGELQQNTVLHIGINVPRVEVLIPTGTAIKVDSSIPPEGKMADFACENKAYWNSPARDHQEPLLYITAPNTSLHFYPL